MPTKRLSRTQRAKTQVLQCKPLGCHARAGVAAERAELGGRAERGEDGAIGLFVGEFRVFSGWIRVNADIVNQRHYLGPHRRP